MGKSAVFYKLATPAAPTVSNTDGGIKISWKPVSGAARYALFYKAAGDKSWTKIGSTTATDYVWKKAKSGTDYTFTVRCVSADKKTYTSAYDTKGTGIRRLAQPRISKFEANNAGLKIAWKAVAGADYYRVYYKTANGWKKLAQTNGTSAVINAKLSKTYTYTVRAFGGGSSSSYDAAGSAFQRLAAPELISVANAQGGVRIQWTGVSGAAKYRVYCKTGSGGWKKIGDTSSTGFLWTGAKSGVTYTFTVRCLTDNAKSYASGYDSSGLRIKAK